MTETNGWNELTVTDMILEASRIIAKNLEREKNGLLYIM